MFCAESTVLAEEGVSNGAFVALLVCKRFQAVVFPCMNVVVPCKMFFSGTKVLITFIRSRRLYATLIVFDSNLLAV